MKHIILLFFISLSLNLFAQDTLPKIIIVENYLPNSQMLEDSFACCKELPDSFKIQTLIALSQYPELQNTPIIFREKRIVTTMVTRPLPSFIFRSRANRRYVIYINNSTKRVKGVLLDTVPFNAQVGVIGHELAHVVDYSEKSNIQILGNGIGYMFHGWRKDFEHSIDIIAIEHGFVWQLYEYSDFILNKSHASDKYKEYKRENYFSPDEILEENEKLKMKN